MELVALRPVGLDRPLFLVDRTQGDASGLLALATALKERVPVHAFPGIDARSKSIEHVAASCVAAVRRVQAHGPYRFAGYCTGGLVAYEIAYQLLADDEPVEYVGLIDTRRPSNRPRDIGAARDASELYCPQPLGIDVTVLASEERLTDHRLQSWSAFTGGMLRPLVIEGTHRGILAAPHVERLADAVNRSLARSAGAASRLSQVDYAPAAQIQAGTGRARPIFCVPGAGASLSAYLPLAQALGERATVYGLQPRGLDGASIPHATVPGAARACARDIRRLAAGPYRLVGHSFGGWVAFEAACQLVAAGERVESVVLIDAESPASGPAEPHACGRVDVLLELVHLVEEDNGCCLGISRADLAALDYEAQLLTLAQRMKANRVLAQAVKVDAIRNLVRVFSMNSNTKYEPASVFDGSVLLIQAQELSQPVDGGARLPPDPDAEAAAWRRHAPRLVRVKSPGKHTTMLKDPNAGSIAAHMRQLWTDL